MSSLPSAIDRAVAEALERLAARLRPHGELPAPATRGETLIPRCDSSPFATAMALRSLAAVPEAHDTELVRRQLDFLEKEDTGGGLWGFWSSHSVQYGGLPPDVDDTASVLDVLRRFGRRVEALRGPLLGNRDRRGRFFTFVLPRWGHLVRPRALGRLWRERRFRSHRDPLYTATPASRDDVDSVVNAHALLWLGDGPQTRRALDWLIDLVARDRERGADKWYPLESSLYLALALLWESGVERLAPARRAILGRLPRGRERAGPVLGPILDLSSRLAFGEPPADLTGELRGLLALRDADGLWPRAILYCNGPERDVGWGSSELSTALALEALARGRAHL